MLILAQTKIQHPVSLWIPGCGSCFGFSNPNPNTPDIWSRVGAPHAPPGVLGLGRMLRWTLPSLTSSCCHLHSCGYSLFAVNASPAQGNRSDHLPFFPPFFVPRPSSAGLTLVAGAGTAAFHPQLILLGRARLLSLRLFFL